MSKLRTDANVIIEKAIMSVQPKQMLEGLLKDLPTTNGKTIIVAIGKAAWAMCHDAVHIMNGQISEGICITKYGHVMGDIPHVKCYEAGHPVPDENSIKATKAVEEMVLNLTEDDIVLFLISGGGSALFEDCLISLDELQDITNQLLRSGADITEINTIRKRLSKVKGGKFASLCAPAHVFSVVLSDIIGDPLDMIASGPAYPDASTCEDAMNIVKKYNLSISQETLSLLSIETPKFLENVETHITGSVRQLCQSAVDEAQQLGYETHLLTSSLTGEAREVGRFLSAIAQEHANDNRKQAYICGGETVVHVTGNGLGGRNQEIALSAAEGIAGLDHCAIFSVGSDGTDGPTDAAGGYVDGRSKGQLEALGISIDAVLQENDAYHALEKIDGLIKTGPTGTNVNDLTVLLIDKKD